MTDEFGDELDWFDEFPDDDPFLPKPTCTNCQGLGEVTIQDHTYTCTWCGGTGVLK